MPPFYILVGARDLRTLSWSIQKKKKNLILGCPRPKYFFSGLPLNQSRH
jgi:hypothetical protein